MPPNLTNDCNDQMTPIDTKPATPHGEVAVPLPPKITLMGRHQGSYRVVPGGEQPPLYRCPLGFDERHRPRWTYGSWT